MSHCREFTRFFLYICGFFTSTKQFYLHHKIQLVLLFLLDLKHTKYVTKLFCADDLLKCQLLLTALRVLFWNDKQHFYSRTSFQQSLCSKFQPFVVFELSSAKYQSTSNKGTNFLEYQQDIPMWVLAAPRDLEPPA